MQPAYVLLAAGRATRMGFPKAFEPLDGIAPIARVAATLGNREIIVVCASADLEHAVALVPNATAFAVNDAPERGMNHSLRCGLTHAAPGRAIGVVLADMPFIAPSTFTRLEQSLAADIDVAFPVDAAGTPGHPVLFSSRARTKLETLGDGDTIRSVRDEASLRQVRVALEDPGAFIDLDKPSDWHAPT